MSADQLLDAFRSLPPWSAKDPGPEGWRNYEHAAELVKKADPVDLNHALLAFLDEAQGLEGTANETRLFLLSRFVFDLPARAPASERRVFKGWTSWPEPDNQGILNLSWPVSFAGGKPALLAPYEGSDGPRYGAVEEYRYLREHYRFREPGHG